MKRSYHRSNGIMEITIIRAKINRSILHQISAMSAKFVIFNKTRV